MLNRYIYELLFENDCVIIPNFGGFVTNYSSAKVHPVLHTFTPPSKQLTFNKSLVVNDGLLASTIAHDKKISFADALLFIADSVRKMEKELADNKRIDIEGVGSFVLNVEKNLIFNAFEAENFNLHSFGLSSFQSMPIRKESNADRLKKKPVDRKPLKISDKKYKLKKLWPIALALPILMALIIIPFRSNFIGYVEKSNFLPNIFEASVYQPRKTAVTFNKVTETNINKLSETNPTIKPLNQADTAVELTISQQEKSIATIDNKETPNYTATKQYHLIGGCFKELENAEKFIEQLNSRGFHASILGKNSKGLYRVSCSSFSKKSDAELAKNELLSSNMNVWVFEN